MSQVVITSHVSPTITSNGIFGNTTKIAETIIPALTDIEIYNSAKKGKNKFAEPKSVDISFFRSASKEIVGDNIVCREKLIGLNATSITVSFDILLLSKKAELYIYNTEGTIVTGPITATENIAQGRTWSTNSFPGNSVIIELRFPKDELSQNELHISRVLLGLPPKMNPNSPSDSLLFGSFNASSSCNRNVLCPEGNAWSNERKAVCLIETENGSSGSGALIMNTCGLIKPYLLTAWHIVNGLNPNNWTFIFGWWSSTCTPNTNNQQALLFNGASLRATYQQTDCSLLELFQTPPSTSDITYLGWSRSSSIPSTSVGIHHPMDDQMKISFANSPATIGTIYTYPNTAWRVLWNLGTIEGGSSGSPLFDPNHRVIGQLYSGTQPVGPPCNQLSGGTNYGRFDLSWAGGGTNATRLSNWLDPSNSGAMTTNTTNISALIPTNFSISGDNFFCTTSNPYTIPSLPTGPTVNWSITPAGIASPNSPSGTQTTLTKNSNGIITLTATVSNFCAGQPIVVTKSNIAVGIPSPSTPVLNWQDCPRESEFQTNYIPGVTYTWSYYKLPNGTNHVFPGSGYIKKFIFTDGSGTYRVGIIANNTCGTSSPIVFADFSINCGGGHLFIVSPNPAANTVNIQLNTPNSTDLKTSLTAMISEVKIFDQLGNLKKQVKYATGTRTVQIDVANLVAGAYFIEISNGQNQEMQQLIIQK